MRAMRAMRGLNAIESLINNISKHESKIDAKEQTYIMCSAVGFLAITTPLMILDMGGTLENGLAMAGVAAGLSAAAFTYTLGGRDLVVSAAKKINDMLGLDDIKNDNIFTPSSPSI